MRPNTHSDHWLLYWTVLYQDSVNYKAQDQRPFLNCHLSTNFHSILPAFHVGQPQGLRALKTSCPISYEQSIKM